MWAAWGASRATADGPIESYEWLSRHRAALLTAIVLVMMPAIAGQFVLVQVFGRSSILGMIALSLMFLAGYGGMVSLVQMTVAGVAGYMTAILGSSAIQTISLGWPLWLAVPAAVLIAVAFGTLSGALAVRTAGIYTTMITLAIAAVFFYFTNQNYAIFNGFTGFNSIPTPHVFGIDWRSPVPFYYLVLALAGLVLALAGASYLGIVYLSRSRFGLALQGTRDNARRIFKEGRPEDIESDPEVQELYFGFGGGHG